jgi:adenylate cyclase
VSRQGEAGVSNSQSSNEQWWRDNLGGRHPMLRSGRTFLKHLPSDPRCKLCAGPFAGAGGVLMRAVGKGPWPRNPKYCSACFRNMERTRGGAEIECSLLFADVRDSTAMAERMGASEFRSVMDRFYGRAARVLVEHDAIVDKFVGDEVMGIFVPALAGERHAARAVAAAQALLSADGEEERPAPLPIGAGVHTGMAFVGTVGEAPHLELTALGDAVNVAARLASEAAAGEVLVTRVAAQAAAIDAGGLEQRELALKGKSKPTSVLVLHG